MMIWNHIKASLRNTRKNSFYTSLNLGGLIIGFGSFIFILSFLIDELSFDRYHPNSEDIYRIVDNMKLDDDFSPSAIIPSGWADGFGSSFQEFLAVARIQKASRFNPVVKFEDQIFTETNFIFIDSTLINILHFDFIYRKPGNPLSYPQGIIISRQTAEKYFGEENPLDKELQVDGDQRFFVTAVVEMPNNNSFKFEFAALLVPPQEDRLWTHTLVKVGPNADITALEQKLASFTQERYGNAGYAARQGMAPNLQPLISIHHYSDLKFEYSSNSSIIYIYMFSAIGFMFLLITTVNFINLTTAKAASRFKEIGVRKALGAKRAQVVSQLLLENTLYVLIAFLISVVIVLMVNPFFNNWSGREIQALAVFTPINSLYIASGILFLGCVSGIYPAISLSHYSFGNQNSIRNPEGEERIRNFLVISQFVISSVMIIGAIIVNRQLTLFQESELGFERDAIVVLSLSDREVKNNHQGFRNGLLEYEAIKNVSFTQTFPGERNRMATLVYKIANSEETTIIPTFLADLNFVNTLEIELIAGRDFDSKRITDKSNCIINRKAAELIGGIDKALGQTMHAIDLNLKGEVIGITENFNFSSLHNAVEPVVIFPVLHFPQAFNTAMIKIERQKLESVLPVIEETWQKFSLDSPLDYSLLDDDLSALYISDLQKGRIFEAFVILSVIISCLGLFGLTFYTLERRGKEIGIRKVLGASVGSITLLFSWKFLGRVLIASIIAIPLAFVAAEKWLAEFAFRVDLSLDIFVVSLVLNLGIAFLTIIFLTLKKARLNPTLQLRQE